MDLSEFASDMRSLASELDDGVNDLVKEVAGAILGDLILRNPVDTSKSLSNWQVKIGAPPSMELNAYFEGQFGSTEGASSSAALAAGRKAMKVRKTGQPIFVSNVLEYTFYLNDLGTSKQAPAGYVDLAVLAGRVIIDTARI